jgi:hypothetical protein
MPVLRYALSYRTRGKISSEKRQVHAAKILL